MSFCNYTDNTECYTSIKKIPKSIWQQLNCTNNMYFNPKYLDAIAQNNKDITFCYLILKDNQQKAIAFTTIQVVSFYVDNVQNDLNPLIQKAKFIGKKTGIITAKKPFKILTCGNTFVSGEHGIFIKPNQNRKKIITEITTALSSYVNSSDKLKKEIDAYMIKDFKTSSLNITDELHKYSFHSFKIDPNMVLTLDSNWTSFEDYLGAMKTKFRVKAKKALKESTALKIKRLTASNIDFYLPKIEALYKEVALKSGFIFGEFNVKSYKSLINNLGDNYLIDVYCLDDKMVGFLSGIFNKNTLDAHFVGIDYKFNKKYYIYQRMLYDYIEKAIERNVSTINFGRTASEIKSSVGAAPQDLTIYFKHKKTISNQLLKLFSKKITPTPFQQKHPFKK